MAMAFRLVAAVLLCGECVAVQQLSAAPEHKKGLVRREHRKQAHKTLLVDADAHVARHAKRLKERSDYVEETGHKHHGHTAWTYDDIAAWPSDCDSSHHAQSPINFADNSSDVPDTASLYTSVSYTAMDNRKIKNNGHNLQVDGDFGQFTLPNGDYDLIQFHFHFPSEHTINGRNAAGEIHMVHKKKDTGALAVIGMFLESNVTFLGGDYPKSEARKQEIDFFTNLGFLSGVLPGKGASVDVLGKPVDIQETFKYELQGTFFHYMGSLTTPPCSEGVHWYILRRPAAVTEEMVAAFKTLFPNPANNRPVQALNSREIDVGKKAVNHVPDDAVTTATTAATAATTASSAAAGDGDGDAGDAASAGHR